MPCAIDLFPLTPPSQDCLRAALAVLMNVTQNNRGGCERVVACGGPAALLPLLAQLVAGGGKSQGGHAPRPMEGGPVCVAAWPSSLPAACTLCMHSPTTPPAAAVSGCAHSRAELVEWVDELRWAGCGARARVGVGIGMPRGAGHRAPPPTRHAMAVPSQTTCSGCLGLLINLAEQGEEWQAQLRGLELAPARGSEGGAPLQLLPLLCELATGARVQGTARQAELRCRGVRFAQLCSTGPAPPPDLPRARCAAVLSDHPPASPAAGAAMPTSSRGDGGEGEVTLDTLEAHGMGAGGRDDEHSGARQHTLATTLRLPVAGGDSRRCHVHVHVRHTRAPACPPPAPFHLVGTQAQRPLWRCTPACFWAFWCRPAPRLNGRPRRGCQAPASRRWLLQWSAACCFT